MVKSSLRDDNRKYVFIVKELNHPTNWSAVRKLLPLLSKAVIN